MLIKKLLWLMVICCTFSMAQARTQTPLIRYNSVAHHKSRPWRLDADNRTASLLDPPLPATTAHPLMQTQETLTLWEAFRTGQVRFVPLDRCASPRSVKQNADSAYVAIDADGLYRLSDGARIPIPNVEFISTVQNAIVTACEIIIPGPTSTPFERVIYGRSTVALNVRAAPAGAILTSVNANTLLWVVGRNASGDWYQIWLPEAARAGWVSAQYVNTYGADTQSLPVINP